MVSFVGILTVVLFGCTFSLQSSALSTSSFLYNKGVQTSLTSLPRNRILRYNRPLSFISEKQRCTLTSLDAVSEKSRTTEESTQLLSSEASINNLPQLTVVAGPGARITSVSQGVSVVQELFDDWEEAWGGGNDSAVSHTGSTPNLTVVAGKGASITSVSFGLQAKHQNFQRIKHKEANDGKSEQSFYVREIRNRVDEGEATKEDTIGPDEVGAGNNDEEEANETDEKDSDTATRAALAKAAILRRAGIVGENTKNSTRRNGRSSLAKKHVVKNTRRPNRGSVSEAVNQVLNTMRAVASATGQSTDISDTGIPVDSSVGRKSELSDGKSESEAVNSVNTFEEVGNISKSPWKAALDSTVANVLRVQNLRRNHNINDEEEFIPYSSISTATPPPPGSTSMGILGEVVQDKLPDIRPWPGQVLVDGSKGSDSPSKHHEITVRSSIPHSSDDTSIADLRLSVFSNFDGDMQQQFRHRSLEVLNVRRKLGAVALVAEVPIQNGGRELDYKDDIHSRVERGCSFGSIDSNFLTSHNTIRNISDDKETTTPRKSNDESTSKWIIGSVECSHHEFRGTLLGNSRPKGSLMYVTEVAVCPEARRCGAGSMLMKVLRSCN
ncbi:hypothetical protein ACHAXS_014271 [Conticribra weissflogii]